MNNSTVKKKTIESVNTSTKVNAWTQWGKLQTIVVGTADNACFMPNGPEFKGHINNPLIDNMLNWPKGKKKQYSIDAANRELNNLASILEERGVEVLRPDALNFDTNIKTPFWEVSNMNCAVCPRDNMITIGNILLEASMSKRGRYFEHLAYRSIIKDMWLSDKNMKWKAAPKPSMKDEMYWQGFWSKYDGFENKPKVEQDKIMSTFEYVLNETEMAFDAADITRCGKDIFVLKSMTTNNAGIEWLRRELEGEVRVHIMRGFGDKTPSHIDATFVPLRPPKSGEPGIVLINPDRPMLEEDLKIFKKNNWTFINAPRANTEYLPLPAFCQCSEWLSMNILSIGPNTIVAEEREHELHYLLESLGFEVIKVPFRNVYEFGGSLHCSTWDIKRDDSCEDFFSIQ